MKIAYIAAGAAGMYCGSCLHDNTLALALRRSGDDVLLIPTYTPIRTDEQDASLPNVYFGGINVYLQQKIPLFRRTPRWLDYLLDSPRLLNFVSRHFANTDPKGLGDLTVSMLAGEHGHQKKELQRLARWLADDVQPDVIHLSNAMLMGMARQMRSETGAAIICSLSGEDIFLEGLIPPYYEQSQQLLRQRAGDADAYVALNRYYADYMIDYMQLAADRVHVIPHGLQIEGHGTRTGSSDGGVTIGYFARLCHDKGLHLLIEAFCQLARRDDLPPLRLAAAGYLGRRDRAYLRQQQRRLQKAGLADRFTYHGEPDRAGKIAFMQSLDMMAIPTVYRESKGLSVLEAMANGVPLVLPDHGAFSELLADTGGGLLHRPEDADSLAEQLTRLIQDRELADSLGKNGQQAVRERYHAEQMSRRTRELYESLVAARVAV